MHTNGEFVTEDQVYLAGFTEGYLSAELILLHMQNIKYNMYNNTDAPWEDVLSLVARTNMDFIAEN